MRNAIAEIRAESDENKSHVRDVIHDFARIGDRNSLFLW